MLNYSHITIAIEIAYIKREKEKVKKSENNIWSQGNIRSKSNDCQVKRLAPVRTYKPSLQFYKSKQQPTFRITSVSVFIITIFFILQMQCTVIKLCYAYMFCLWFSCSYLTWKDFLFGDDRPWHPFKSGSSKQMCAIQVFFFFYYYYSACSQSSQRVMQVIAFPSHLCLCLAVQIKVLPKLFFRKSDHQVGWCPSGRFNLSITFSVHRSSFIQATWPANLFFFAAWSHLSPLTYPADVFLRLCLFTWLWAWFTQLFFQSYSKFLFVWFGGWPHLTTV